MTDENRLNQRYFDWLCRLVNDGRHGKSWNMVLSRLHATTFTWTMPIDRNRAEDGRDLRYRFGTERNVAPDQVKRYLDSFRPCSVLEMMAALALRCEEQIMEDPSEGNRTGTWFWGMMENLGLGGMSDLYFDKVKTDRAIDRLLRRNYRPNGEGGLFTLRHCEQDLRRVEIWYQAMWYLNEVLEK